jgi:pyrimidine oxygenase
MEGTDVMNEMPRLQLGVFLPNASNGFLVSGTAPQYAPTFKMNKQISILAENIGLDYVFSMSKWRDFGGPTGFWQSTLESVTLMTGLAAVTSRIGIIATMQPVLFPPAVAAKMAATIDDLSNGRFGINIVTGSFLDEFEQMDILPPNYAPNRYRYAEEWLHVVKRLWTEESVTFDGEWFHMKDCRSLPHPVQKPYPFIVCAGTSEEGFRFTAKEGNYSFVNGVTLEHSKQLSSRMKEIAAERGRTIKTAISMFPVIGETDTAAQKHWQYLQDGADTETMTNIAAYFSKRDRVSDQQRLQKLERDVSYSGRMVHGSPSTIADIIEDVVVNGHIDSVMLFFDDFVGGLNVFHTEVMPLLKRRELLLATERMDH